MHTGLCSRGMGRLVICLDDCGYHVILEALFASPINRGESIGYTGCSPKKTITQQPLLVSYGLAETAFFRPTQPHSGWSSGTRTMLIHDGKFLSRIIKIPSPNSISDGFRYHHGLSITD